MFVFMFLSFFFLR